MPSPLPARAHALNSVRSCSSIRVECCSLCEISVYLCVSMVNICWMDHHRDTEAYGGNTETNLRSQPVQHPGKWNRFADVFNSAHPGGAAFDAHAKAGVGDTAIAAQIQIPFESLLRQAMRSDLLLQKLQRG